MSKSLTGDVTTTIATDCQPIILLEFQLSSTVRYALFETDITYDGNTYTGIGGKLGDITESSDLTINSVKIRLKNISQTFSAYVFSLNPTEFRGKTMIVTRIFAEHIDDNTDYETLWEGICTGWQLDGRDFLIDIKHWIYSLNDEAPRRNCNPMCQWEFGGSRCALTANAGGGAGNYDEQTAQTADAGSTQERLVDAARSEADDYWNDGFVTFTTGDNAGFPARKVSDSDQGSTYVDFETPWPYTIDAGDQYTIIQGCDHTDNTCQSRFDNMVNYGGNLSVPRKAYR